MKKADRIAEIIRLNLNHIQPVSTIPEKEFDEALNKHTAIECWLLVQAKLDIFRNMDLLNNFFRDNRKNCLRSLSNNWITNTSVLNPTEPESRQHNWSVVEVPFLKQRI
jgi:hypothetical protein